MSGPYHDGERELQRRAGVLEEAEAVARIIRADMPAAAARFLQGQRLAIVSSLDAAGRVSVSQLTGRAGFLGAVDSQLLRISAQPAPDDPLRHNLAARPELGLLVLDPSTRQRMRFNGRGLLSPEGIFVRVRQVYGNCPKYVRRRTPRDAEASPPGSSRLDCRLSHGQQAWIRRADTFFIGSFHPAGGADVSHRGGPPGFVRVAAPDRLAFDDSPGNGMFNTLGNLLEHPRAGLLFVDFENGDLLQVSGSARVEGDFSVGFAIESVRETPSGSSLRWDLLE